MEWNFWKKGSNNNKLPKPKEIPEPVGRYLVVKLGKDPDWVWSLKGVVQPRQEKKNCFDVRVYDAKEARMKDIIVRDYASLAEYPDLILFEGWFDKVNMIVFAMEDRTAPAVIQRQ